MVRISTIFIAISMVVIAASLGVATHYLIGLNGAESAIVALAALTFLVLYNAVSMRLRDRTDVGGQIADLSRGTADLARQVAEFGRRLAYAESRLVGLDADARKRVEPLAAEIVELGALVRQLAVAVAAQDEARETAASAIPAPDSAAVPAISVAPAAPAAAPQPAVSAARLAATLTQALEANRVELYVQPLVTLPQRKVRYYEAVARVRDEAGTVIAAADFIDAADQAGLMPRIDHVVLFRCVQVLRRLMLKNKDIGLFCNIAAATLSDPVIFAQCLEFLDANRALAPALVLEFRQDTLRHLDPVESEHLAALVQRGYRLSVDHVADLQIEPRELADRGVRFLKVPAKLLLDERGAEAANIHPADLSDLLGRFGIDLVAEKIEGERAVVDLLDYDVHYGQGFLFAPPRPLRQDNATAAPPPDAPPEPRREAATPVSEPAARGAIALAALARRTATTGPV
ncbi:MAG: EAL domain-containing protein [Xanthobacteraceae bacterium]|nr:MAG: EAL domain-containing protein [Xanthobacteraceae bacterium]